MNCVFTFINPRFTKRIVLHTLTLHKHKFIKINFYIYFSPFFSWHGSNVIWSWQIELLPWKYFFWRSWTFGSIFLSLLSYLCCIVSSLRQCRSYTHYNRLDRLFIFLSSIYRRILKVFVTGNTSLCDWIYEYAWYHHCPRSTLQNCYKILKMCFLVISYYIVS